MSDVRIDSKDLFEIVDTTIVLKQDLIIDSELHKKGEVFGAYDPKDSPHKYFYIITRTNGGNILKSKMPLK